MAISLEDAYGPAPPQGTGKISFEEATAPTQPQQPETWNEYLSGLAGQYMQGATFGFGDEIKGAIEGGKAKLLRGEDYGPAYEQGRDEARAGLKQFRERHPGQTVG